MSREALARLYDQLWAVERRRNGGEPPLELTDAYSMLLFACGFARLGAPRRAASIAREATALLAEHADDPVHTWLARAFPIRIAGDALPAALFAELDSFNRVMRYKVDRFREASRLFNPEPVDAMARMTSPLEPDKIVAACDDCVAATGDPDRLVFLVASLDPTTTPPDLGRRCLDVVLPRIEFVSPATRARVIAYALRLAATHAPAQVPALVEAFVLAIPAASNTDGLAPLLEALAPDHGGVWTRLPRAWLDTPIGRAGSIRLGAAILPTDLDAIVGAVRRGPDALFDALVDAQLAKPLDDPGLLALYAATTDDFSTASHFVYRVVVLVDRIVRCAIAPQC